MDAIREQAKNPLVTGIVAFVLGLLIGLIVLGWGLFPVQWTDGTPDNLRRDLKDDYLRMAIDSYSTNPDMALAKTRYESLGEDAAEFLAEVVASPGTQRPEAITAFQVAVGASTAGAPAAVPTTAPGGTPAAATSVAGGEVATPKAEGSTGRSLVSTILPVLCVILLLVAGGAGAYLYMKSRSATPAASTPSPAMQAHQAAQQAEWTDYTTAGEEAPMAQFMASYKMGDDLFDDSFSIDSPSGEFLGECGVGISETIGVGDPKKVTAFEVWLFDKNDIQTVTKVLMSANAYMDEGTRQRLQAKGEPVLVEPGTETVLETQSLRMAVRVVDTGYGEGPLPAQSFFDRMILELAVWPKTA